MTKIEFEQIDYIKLIPIKSVSIFKIELNYKFDVKIKNKILQQAGIEQRTMQHHSTNETS